MKHDLFLGKVVLHRTEIFVSASRFCYCKAEKKTQQRLVQGKEKKVNDPQKICENIAMSSLPQSQLA